jgi:hypothetical protein
MYVSVLIWLVIGIGIGIGDSDGSFGFFVQLVQQKDRDV